MPGKKFARLFRLVACWTVLLSVIIFVIGISHRSISIPFSILRIDGATIALVGFVMGIIRLVFVRYRSPVSVSLFLLQTLGIVAFVLGGKEAGRGTREISIVAESTKEKVWTSSVDWFEPHTEPSHQVGYRGLPDAEARHHHRDYDVTYHTGPDGFRLMPTPRSGPTAPEIIFLGCSMTFGIGAEDDEYYAWLLAKNAWPDYKVLNWSVSGWGTTHASVMLDEALQHQPKPVLIIYAMIAGHLERNYLRKSWRSTSAAHFPFFNERGDFVRLRPFTDGDLPNTKEVDEAEIRLARNVIAKMKEKCDRAGVPFAVFALQNHDQYQRDIFEVLDQPGLCVVDVCDDFSERHPSDAHLTPMWHQRLARAIASRKDLAELTGRPDLYQPTAFPAMFPDEDSFRSEVFSDETPEKHRRIKFESSPTHAIVGEIESHGSERFQMRLGRLLPSIQAGQYVTISFVAESPSTRSLSFLLENWTLPARFYSEATAFSTNRGTSQYCLKVTESCRWPRFILQFGGDDRPFSIKDFKATISDTVPPGLDWLEVFADGPIDSDAVLTHLPPDQKTSRVDRLRALLHEAWTVRYQVSAGPVSRGQTYLIRGNILPTSRRSSHSDCTT
jgi:hypothetical protein